MNSAQRGVVSLISHRAPHIGFSFTSIFSPINEFGSAKVSWAKLCDVLDSEVEISLHEDAKLGQVKSRI
jgi:hypothetical protein